MRAGNIALIYINVCVFGYITEYRAGRFWGFIELFSFNSHEN